ncbi:TIGR01666 family membrane protein [Aeromonas veronii]|uniref:YccS family putative transporter n=1 Tax=Aeromonas veronii TaxID=654 RepID=UPI00222F5BED|nr:YccS family putative transporter [Aeromonas veronii]EKP0299105.1 TIGR01666 family membrane protein [Aeromonas veronii]UZE58571.1 YccS family putative transporter [Aeromonas veronii]
MPMEFSGLLRRLLTDSHIYFALKVLLAILGLLAFTLATGNIQLTVLLSLGVVAGAIAETDDSLWGRLKNLAMTLICFMFASLCVQYLYPTPWLFAIGLASSTFIFVMVGALGARYATISFGSLLIAIYTMLGAAKAPDLFYQPLALGAGALWYGLVSFIWLWLLPYKTLHEQLAQSYFALGRYLLEKSRFFPADEHGAQAIRHNLAQLNINLVNALTLTKSALNARLSRHPASPELASLLRLYLLALEIHERATSSHYPYSRLEAELKQGIVLEGFQEVFLQLSEACQRLGYAILVHKPYAHNKRIHWTLEALGDQLEFTNLKQHYPKTLLTPMKFLRRNLASINQLLGSAEVLQNPEQPEQELPALARPPRLPLLTQLKQHLTLHSMVFRHALRLSLGLVIGYGILQAFDLEKGYWILLTVLFVCQPSYSATRRRLVQRMLGTFAGILVGIPVLWLFPELHVQLVVMGLAAFLFFTQVRNNYSAAVCFITLYVLMAFNLLDGIGFAILGPRLLDTLLGCLISYGLVAWLWPDWQYKRLPTLIANSLSANARYLSAVLASLKQQRDESIDYRVARKSAHLADSELATAWQSMLVEPQKRRRFLDLCFTLTWRNHALLSYISALGAHRDKLEAISGLDEVRHHICHTLEQAAGHLAGNPSSSIGGQCPVISPDSSEEQLMLTQQLNLISELADQLLHLANESRLLTGDQGATMPAQS